LHFAPVPCATVEHYTAVPPSEKHEATILGLANARLFPDRPEGYIAEQERALIREAKAAGVGPGGTLPTAYMLSLSGVAIMEPSALDCWSVGRLMAISEV
jgi:hypothetical protein